MKFCKFMYTKTIKTSKVYTFTYYTSCESLLSLPHRLLCLHNVSNLPTYVHINIVINCGEPSFRRVQPMCEHLQSNSFFEVDLSVSCKCEEFFEITTNNSLCTKNI